MRVRDLRRGCYECDAISDGVSMVTGIAKSDERWETTLWNYLELMERTVKKWMSGLIVSRVDSVGSALFSTPFLVVAILAASFLTAAFASPSSNILIDIGLSEGQVRVEFRELRKDKRTVFGEIQIRRAHDSSILQRVSTNVQRNTVFNFSSIDLNDDGYKDLLFYHDYREGWGDKGAVDVFLWIPRLKSFVKSETLSGPWEIEKSKSVGCATAMEKCSTTSWRTREFCFNQTSGRWRIQSDNRCPSQTE